MRTQLGNVLLSFAILGVFAALVWLPDSGEEIERFTGPTMGTSYTVQVAALPASMEAEALSERIDTLLGRLDKEVFSTYAPGSELSRLNRHPVGVPFEASAEMLAVLSLAQEISELSGGAFDVTVGPLVNLWGFGPDLGPEGDRIPDPSSLAQALALVDYSALIINASRAEVIKTAAVAVDLSAIAKGFAVDEVALALEDEGVNDYFIEVGGELKMSGRKPDGSDWIPAIETPDPEQSSIYEIIHSRGETLSLAGSGDYRNYFETDGVRYTHEIDPRTGRPVQHNLAAVYVIDSQAARADALATAFMILGLDAAKQLAAGLEQPVYLIYRKPPTQAPQNSFDAFISDAFARYLGD